MIKSSIILPTTEMQIRYRVMAWNGAKWTLLFTSENYQTAEDFCWNYTGNSELDIKKIWIRK